MMIGKKLIGLALAGSLPLLTLVPGTVSAESPQILLLPSVDGVVPHSQIVKSRPVALLNPSSPFSFGVVLPSKNPQGLTAFAAAVNQPGSPQYHHFLNHAQEVAEFGPAAALVSQMQSQFTAAGLTATLSGQMLEVRGTVAQVNTLFKTQMTRYQQGNITFSAPSNGILMVPVWLQQAQGLTGFVRSQPRTGFLEAKHLSLHYLPKADMAPTPGGATASASNNGFTVTVQQLSDGARTPGEAVRYVVTASVNGQPDPNQIYVQNLQGPYVGASSLAMWYPGQMPNQILTDFTLSQEQTVSMALTVNDTNGNSVTVQLPAAAFVGPSAATTTGSSLVAGGLYGVTGSMLAPWNPASNSVNKPFNAQQLVAFENSFSDLGTYGGYHNAPTIGVYTAGGISNNGSYTGIGFSVPEGDAQMFASKFNLTPETFHTAYVGQNSYVDSSYGGIEGEMSLDLQMMETSAPGSNILVYSAGSLRSALNQVGQQDSVAVFSISYGAGEQIIAGYDTPGTQASWDELAQLAVSEGITISVSSGDSGAYSGAEYAPYGVPTSIAYAPQPSYPANSPYVSALGGTEDAVTPTGHLTQGAMWGGNLGREISNSTLMNYLSFGNMMASGGVSTIESAPSYQTALTPGLTGRMTPDVSLPASVVTPGYFGYFDGQPNLSGGTSAAAPLFAGWIADMTYDGPLGNVNPTLYQMSQWPGPRLPEGPVVTPVAFGNNGFYNETTRDNAVTGLGQLNVDGFTAAQHPYYFSQGGGNSVGGGGLSPSNEVLNSLHTSGSSSTTELTSAWQRN